MPYDEALADRIRTLVRKQPDFTERRMFGGLAFLWQGRMCCGIVASDLMVRVTAREYDTLVGRRHVRPMDFTGKPMRGFLFISPPGFETAVTLRGWVSRGKQAAREKASTSRPSNGRKRTPSTLGGATARRSAAATSRRTAGRS